MEHLWSPAGANGGNRSQKGQPRNRLRQCDRQPVATYGNGSGAHGTEGVSGSSPEEGSARAPRAGAFSFGAVLLCVQPAVGMARLMEPSRREQTLTVRLLAAVFFCSGMVGATLIDRVGCANSSLAADRGIRLPDEASIPALAARSSPAAHGQKFIAVTSDKSSGPHGKLMPVESAKHVGAEAATGEESERPGEARTESSVRAAASYPMIVRSYEPVDDLDERLRRIFAVLRLPPIEW